MPIKNQSPRSTANLNRLLAFASGHFSHVEGVPVFVYEAAVNVGAAMGKAVWSPSAKRASVSIEITEHSYPFADNYEVIGVPRPTFNDADEEFLYVLAHELEHVDQFYTDQHKRFSTGFLEFRAERKAASVLLAYRQRHRKVAMHPVDSLGAIAKA